MKQEFDLSNLTDADVEFLEEALSRRRLMKLCYSEIRYKIYSKRFSCSNVSWI